MYLYLYVFLHLTASAFWKPQNRKSEEDFHNSKGDISAY
jgi:hypothetical protein